MGKMTEDRLSKYKQMLNENKWFTNTDLRVVFNHIDAIESEKDRLIENVTQIQKQYDRLQLNRNDIDGQLGDLMVKYDLLEGQLDAKKVVLPKEVAEAIEFYKEHGRDFILCNIGKVGQLSEMKSNHRAESIRNYISISPDNTITYLKALINGYTVEEDPTTEERIKNKLYEELVFQGIQSPIEVSKLAQNLTLAIREILAEDAVKQNEAE